MFAPVTRKVRASASLYKAFHILAFLAFKRPTIPLKSAFFSTESRDSDRTNIQSIMSKAQQRLSQVQSHLASSEADIPRGRESILAKSPDDIVITGALRTPFTKGGKGGLKDTPASDLLVHVFKSLVSRSKIDPSLVEDIAVGSVLPPGGGATEFRAAALVAGFPESTAVKSLNRQCSSGLQAVADIANAIRSVRIFWG